MKKILFGITALAVVIATVPMFAAFEAHVINVTAKIENALQVNATRIQFGTVFPQEHLNKPLSIALSGSFLEEGRVDDVNYIIRQKPKCGITSVNGTVLDESSTKTGEPVLGPNDVPTVDCGDAPRQLATGENWGSLPSLCQYISKEPDNTPAPGNDGSLASFHEPYTFSTNPKGQVVWNDVQGHLTKAGQDTVDNWTIDLSVPCFGGYCAQDWATFVHGQNPNADPTLYTQPIANEHKVFGCDLWVEVNGVSRNPRGELSTKQSSTGEALAGWSTFGGQAGLLAHLKVLGTDGTNGDEARVVIQASEVGITTLDDLDTISWGAFGVTGYAPHVDVIVDTNNDNTGDDALVFEYAKVNPLSCDNSALYPIGDFNTFKDNGIVNSTAYAWRSNGPAGPCGDGTFEANHMSLVNWKLTGTAGINGSTRVLRLEIEVDNWIQSSEAYINNVLVNGI